MTTNAILSEQETIESTMKSSPTKPNDGKLGETTLNGGKPNGGKLSEANCWHAVVKRDRSLDGMFVFAVSSTGVFCRPSCPARRPQRQNVQFFEHATAAEQAGYRACLRCRPKAVDGNPQSALVRAMCRYIEQNIEDRLTLGVLATKFRRSAFHLQRMFKSVLGVSPKAYIDACRLRQVKQNLQAGHDVTTSLYAAGYGSSSRLYERTASQLGMTPAAYVEAARLDAARALLESTTLSLQRIADTCGFAGTDALRRAFQRRLGVTALDYRRRFRALTPPA